MRAAIKNDRSSRGAPCIAGEKKRAMISSTEGEKKPTDCFGLLENVWYVCEQLLVETGMRLRCSDKCLHQCQNSEVDKAVIPQHLLVE